jgi:Rieske Fe-S protein
MIPRGSQNPADTERDTIPPDGRPQGSQPRWRKDFPIDWAQDEYVSRRDFVKFTVLTSAAFVVGQFWIVAKGLFRRDDAGFEPTAIARVDAIPVGGAKVFTYPEDSTPRLLVRTGERAFVAYDQQCTHLLCPIVPLVATGRLHCPCHNGWFDLHTGEPLAGPPRRALPRVLVEVRGDTVYATGVVEPNP